MPVSYTHLGGMQVTICVPDGETLAKKTFNPQLGIEGGISILGTSGIVEPMSVQALIDTVALSLRQARAQGAQRVVLTPGNYGEDFLRAGSLFQMCIRDRQRAWRWPSPHRSGYSDRHREAQWRREW